MIVAIIRGDSILELRSLSDISLVVEQKEIEFVSIDDYWWISPTNNDGFFCGTYKYCYVENLNQEKFYILNDYFLL